MLIFWISLLFDVAFAGMYYALAKAVSARKVSGNGQWAMYGFTTWWAALSLTSGLGVISKLVQYFIGWNTAAYFGYIGLVLVVIMYALAGLQYYLVFLVTGWWGAWKPVIVYYMFMIAFSVYFMALSDITSISIDDVTGNLVTENANDLSDSWQTLTFSLMLLLPVLIGAFAYASFFFKVEDRTQRFRIAMVSIGFLVWFGVSLSGNFASEGATEGLGWVIITKIVAIIAIWMNYQAFKPSKWVQERFKIQPV